MDTNTSNKNLLYLLLFSLVAVVLLSSTSLLAQTGLESRIHDTIDDLVRIVNILIVGFVVWSGFIIARGEPSGMTRLIYGIIGLLVVNASHMIINYFMY